MKAIVIHEYGPPEVLRYEDVPDPVPRSGRNPHQGACRDRQSRARREPARRQANSSAGAVLPLIPGVDCAGIVDAVGPQVGRWRVGDRVAAAGVMPLEPLRRGWQRLRRSAGHDGHQAAGRLCRDWSRCRPAPRSRCPNISTFITPRSSCATCRRHGIFWCTSPS